LASRERQQLHDVASQVQDVTLPVASDRDAVDEGPQDRSCLGTTFWIVQCDMQLIDLLAVEFGESGVKPWRRRRRCLDRFL
jgi:hypothetical protein